MSKNRNSSRSLRISVLAAVLVALSIVCGKFMQIPVGETLRFSFENLPILLAGMAFGPLTGGLVGLLADIIGSILHGYVINPFITLGAVMIGLVGGGVFRYTPRLSRSWRVVVAVVAAHLVGSVGIKSVGIALFYATPFAELLLLRLINYGVVGTVEALLLVILFRNKAVVSALSREGDIL